VEAGTTVTWTNGDGEPHTVTAVDGSFTSDLLQEHQTYSHSFASPGQFEYYCTIHTLMTGVVVVE